MPQIRYNYPFGLPLRLSVSGPLTEAQLGELIGSASPVSIEVVLSVEQEGQPSRRDIGAGYLVHIERRSTGFDLFSFRGESLTNFPDLASLTRFVNHASGLHFDPEFWEPSEQLNLRLEVEVATPDIGDLDTEE